MRSFTLALLLATGSTLVSSVARADDPSPDGAPAPPAFGSAPPTSDSEGERDRVLFGAGVQHGVYGGPEIKVTSFTGDAAMLVGGQAGWIINRSFVLGVAGYGLPTSHTPDPSLLRPEGPSRIGFGYGGARLAYVTRPHHVLHFGLGVLVGAGGVTVMTRDRTDDRYDAHDGGAVFALEPQGELEINVHRFMRVSFGASYRYISGTSSPGLAASDLSGPAGALAFKFGRF